MSDRMVQLLLVTSVLMLIALFANTAFLFAIAFPIFMFSWMFMGALRNGKIGAGYAAGLCSTLMVWLVGFLSMNAIDTTVDYFVPIRGELHHTFLPAARDEPLFLGADALGVAAAGGVLLLIVSVYLAMLTRIEMERTRHDAS